MKSVIKRISAAFVCIGMVLIAQSVLADSGSAPNLGTLAEGVAKNSMVGVAKLMSAGAMVAGIGFFIGAIMKFKQHKDAPQQHPIGGPIALVFIAAALIFMPNLLSIVGKTFLNTTTTGKLTGTNTFITNAGGT
jgi:intracellular multiplication protein IcmD